MASTDQLLTLARVYCDARGLSRSRVATIIFNDGKKFDLIERGADLGTKKFEFALRWFSTNWPANAVWPITVPRPEPAPAPEPERAAS